LASNRLSMVCSTSSVSVDLHLQEVSIGFQFTPEILSQNDNIFFAERQVRQRRLGEPDELRADRRDMLEFAHHIRHVDALDDSKVVALVPSRVVVLFAGRYGILVSRCDRRAY